MQFSVMRCRTDQTIYLANTKIVTAVHAAMNSWYTNFTVNCNKELLAGVFVMSVHCHFLTQLHITLVSWLLCVFCSPSTLYTINSVHWCIDMVTLCDNHIKMPSTQWLKANNGKKLLQKRAKRGQKNLLWVRPSTNYFGFFYWCLPTTSNLGIFFIIKEEEKS